MVDIHSIAGSSRPSHCGQGSEHEATSHSRAGRPRRTNARDATTAAAQRQHSAAIVAMMPLGVGVEATLEAAR
jgi:hypothetical protein